MKSLLLLAVCVGLAAETETKFQNVVVKRGDTLWGISNTYLKDPSKWDEILKHNRLPSSDPTVALPGMTLRVPVRLIKENLRAAHVITMVNRVDFRRKDTAAWSGARVDMEVFKGDALRTLEDSRARVKFLSADLLSVDPNSLVIIKPPSQDYDIELKAGSIFTGRSSVVTASARVTPKTRDTQFSTQVAPDLTTRVAVHRGLAAVEGQGRTVDVKAGMSTDVKLGMAPGVPTAIPDLPEFEARAALFNDQPVRRQAKVAAGSAVANGAVAEDIERASDASQLRGEIASLRIGTPISGFRVQASLTREFDKLTFNKLYDPDERFEPRYESIPPGVYWFRIAMVDLLGTEGPFSEPRLFSMGITKKDEQVDLKGAVKLVKPAKDGEVSPGQYFKVVGVAKNDRVTISVNGKAVRLDDHGNFSMEVKLSHGPNPIDVVVTDPRGNSTTITRRVLYQSY